MWDYNKKPIDLNIIFTEFEKLFVQALFITIVTTCVTTLIILILVSKKRNMDEANEECVIRARLPIPMFNSTNIELWFIQLENWFLINQIKSDANKFSTVVAALDAKLLQQIFSIVNSPPTTDKYKGIKEAVLRNFADSEALKTKKLISGLELGDKKPSHLLNDFRRIGGPNQDEGMIKALWLQRLPLEVQTILASQKSELNELAELADSIMETFRFQKQQEIMQVNAVTKINENSTLLVMKELQESVRKLAEQVASLQSRIEKQPRNNGYNSRSHSRGRSQSRSRQNNFDANSTECWYHQVWKDKANNCISPCTYPKN